MEGGFLFDILKCKKPLNAMPFGEKKKRDVSLAGHLTILYKKAEIS